jgi:uncharacterized OB-fold protein
MTRPEHRKGVYELPFWEHVAREDLRLQRCVPCGDLRFPPAAVCPACLSDAYEWAPLGGGGTVLAWTVFHRQYFDALPVPYTVVAVQTDEGPVLVGNWMSDRRAAVGDRVRLVYEHVSGDPDDWTIYQWKPLEEGHDH